MKTSLAGDQELCHKYLQAYAAAATHCQPIHFLRCGGDELFVGRAGFICGALWLRKTLGVDVSTLVVALWDLSAKDQ